MHFSAVRKKRSFGGSFVEVFSFIKPVVSNDSFGAGSSTSKNGSRKHLSLMLLFFVYISKKELFIEPQSPMLARYWHQVPYGFGVFKDGTEVPNMARRAYARMLDPAHAREQQVKWFKEEAGHVSFFRSLATKLPANCAKLPVLSGWERWAKWRSFAVCLSFGSEQNGVTTLVVWSQFPFFGWVKNIRRPQVAYEDPFGVAVQFLGMAWVWTLRVLGTQDLKTTSITPQKRALWRFWLPSPKKHPQKTGAAAWVYRHPASNF